MSVTLEVGVDWPQDERCGYISGFASKHFLTMFDMSFGKLWDLDAFSGVCKIGGQGSIAFCWPQRRSTIRAMSCCFSSQRYPCDLSTWKDVLEGKGMTRAVFDSQVSTIVSTDNMKACHVNFDQT